MKFLWKGEACLGPLSNYPEIQGKLNIPTDYPTEDVHICAFQHGATKTTVFRTRHSSIAELESFLGTWSRQTHTTWRVTKTDPNRMAGGLRNVYWAQFHCQSSNVQVRRKHRQVHSKHNNCDARLSVTIKKQFDPSSSSRKSRSTNPHLPEFPTIIKLDREHNHTNNCLENLKFQDVSPDVERKFVEFYNNGHSPLSALEVHKYDLQMQYGEDFFAVAADRSMCPDMKWCYRLYYNTKKQSFPNVDQSLAPKTFQYNLELNQECVKLSSIDDELVIAVCTPIMHRVHLLWPYSHEILLVHTTKHSDKSVKFKVISFLTYGNVGGLPLGIIVTSSESQSSIERGVELLMELVGEKGFHGNGRSGPKIVLTEDSAEERRALANCFPASTHILCASHFLQAMWRYLWNPKLGIPETIRRELFQSARNIVCSETLLSMDRRYQQATNYCLLKNYNIFLSQLNYLWELRDQWAIGLNLTHDTATHNSKNKNLYRNNFSEIALRILRDRIFYRLKRFSMLQVLDFVMTRFDSYYERRLLDVSSCEMDGIFLCRNLKPEDDISTNIDAIKRSEVEFLVIDKSNNCQYIVDRSIGICSCSAGMSGGHCRHQYAVDRSFNGELCFDECSEREHAIFREIATGATDPNKYNAVPVKIQDSSCEDGIVSDQFLNYNELDLESESTETEVTENGGGGGPAEIIDDPLCVQILGESEVPIVYVSVEEFLKHINVDNLSVGDDIVGDREQSDIFSDARTKENDLSLNEIDIAEQESVLISLDETFQKLKTKLLLSPKDYVPAISAFVNSAIDIKTDGELVMALKSFGNRNSDSGPTNGVGPESLVVSPQPRNLVDLFPENGCGQKIGANPSSVPEHGYSKAKRKITGLNNIIPLKSLKIIK